MNRKALIFDTSVLCVYLQIPHREECGEKPNYWTYDKIQQKLTEEEAQGTVFILPLATVIETGNHITHAGSQRYTIAQKLAEIMQFAANEESPWVAFSEQVALWSGEGLKALAREWQSLVFEKISLGDVTIKTLAEYYAQKGYEIEILTGDTGLKAYEPPPPQRIPKRRSDR
jgi:hypothetical protein